MALFYIHELREAMITCTRPKQHENSKNSGIHSSGTLYTPPLTEELWAVDSYWEG